jgi:hypothetical protein
LSFICFITAAVTVGHSAWAEISFDDEFDASSLHRTWQQGDKWQLMAPDSTTRRPQLGRRRISLVGQPL